VFKFARPLLFLADDGRPLQRYFDYLDQTRSAIVMAEGVKEAYADLFKVNKAADKLSKIEIFNKLKTLTQGQYSEGVLNSMTATFSSLCGHADFEAAPVAAEPVAATLTSVDTQVSTSTPTPPIGLNRGALSIGGLVYNIELVLPESRDPKVYDALFESLRKHLT
jgi:hypothetical protein